MGIDITLKASDGHDFSAYICEPEGEVKGAIIVIQEIFGVNEHIRDVTERYSMVGYKTIAPALYDRYTRGFEAGYALKDIEQGRKLKSEANENIDGTLADLDATRAAVSDAGSVGITGFCWGGFASWIAASRLEFQAAACYYGGGIIDFNNEAPRCPTILHFGQHDKTIPLSEVDEIAEAHPGIETHLYDADHGFHCDMRGQYDPRAANVAGMRTIRLFDQYVAN